jgi:hypothetical protein
MVGDAAAVETDKKVNELKLTGSAKSGGSSGGSAVCDVELANPINSTSTSTSTSTKTAGKMKREEKKKKKKEEEEEEEEDTRPHAYGTAWEEMTDSERSYASDSYIKHGLASGGPLKMLYNLVMEVDAPFMAIGCVGAMCFALGQSMMPLVTGKMGGIVAEAIVPGSNHTDLVNRLTQEGNDAMFVLALLCGGKFFQSNFIEVSGSRVICTVLFYMQKFTPEGGRWFPTPRFK